jgi:predicted aspartyl protease
VCIFRPAGVHLLREGYKRCLPHGPVMRFESRTSIEIRSSVKARQAHEQLDMRWPKMLMAIGFTAGLIVSPVNAASAVSDAGPQPGAEASLGSRVESATPAPLFASPTRMDRIGRILVPVTVNGHGPFRMLVDTGAAQSTLSPHMVQELRLEPHPTQMVRVNGITGTADLPAVSVERMQCGEFVVEHAQMPVILAPIMADADGILGIAGLQSERLVVDFQHDRVSLEKGRAVLTDFYRVPAKRLHGGLFSVPVRIGGVKATAIIDTGSERTLGNVALRNALNAKRPDLVPHQTDVYGATTDVSTGEMLLTPSIMMGPVVLANVTVVYGDFHIFEVWELEDRPAIIIGMDVLGTSRAFAIDFARSEVYFKGFHQGPLEINHGLTSRGRFGDPAVAAN